MLYYLMILGLIFDISKHFASFLRRFCLEMEIISYVIVNSINSYFSLLYGSLVLYLDHGDKVAGSNPLPSKLFTIFFAIDKSFDGFIFLNGDVILSHYLSYRFRRKYLHVIIRLISLLNDGK